MSNHVRDDFSFALDWPSDHLLRRRYPNGLDGDEVHEDDPIVLFCRSASCLDDFVDHGRRPALELCKGVLHDVRVFFVFQEVKLAAASDVLGDRGWPTRIHGAVDVVEQPTVVGELLKHELRDVVVTPLPLLLGHRSHLNLLRFALDERPLEAHTVRRETVSRLLSIVYGYLLIDIFLAQSFKKERVSSCRTAKKYSYLSQ